MFFTKNDFEKIAEYLKENAMKDTDFYQKESVSANSDILTIVSEGVNYKVYISDLFKSGIPQVTIDSLKAISIQAQDIKANRSLIINASNIRLDNDKGVTLQDVINHFEENKLDKNASENTFEGHLTVNNGLTVNNNTTIKGPTTITGNTAIKGNVTISNGSINLGNTTITDQPNDVKINKPLVIEGDITAIIPDSDGVKSIHLSDVNYAAKGWQIEQVNPTSDLVREEYKLIDYQNNQKGFSIKIYKDSAIKKVYIGTTEDSINSNTGIITYGIGNTALCILYTKSNGKYELAKVNIEEALANTEFSSKVLQELDILKQEQDRIADIITQIEGGVQHHEITAEEMDLILDEIDNGNY